MGVSMQPAAGSPVGTFLRTACLAAALGASPPAAAASPDITPAAAAAVAAAGVVETASGAVAASRDGAIRPLGAGAAVGEGDVIETGQGAAAAVVRFADGSRLALGAGTRASLGRFAYDPATGRGRLSVLVAAGAFEFASGRMDKDGYDIRTPFATLSLRGTRVGVDVANEAIFVVEGEAVARFLTGETVSLKPSECTFRAAGLRSRESGIACGESFEAFRRTLAALRAEADRLAPDIVRQRLGIRLPSPDQRRASPN
jgi:hypothetical protein